MSAPDLITAGAADRDAFDELLHDMQHGTHGEWLHARRRKKAAEDAVLLAAYTEQRSVINLDELLGGAR